MCMYIIDMNVSAMIKYESLQLGKSNALQLWRNSQCLHSIKNFRHNILLSWAVSFVWCTDRCPVFFNNQLFINPLLVQLSCKWLVVLKYLFVQCPLNPASWHNWISIRTSMLCPNGALLCQWSFFLEIPKASVILHHQDVHIGTIDCTFDIPNPIRHLSGKSALL